MEITAVPCARWVPTAHYHGVVHIGKDLYHREKICEVVRRSSVVHRLRCTHQHVSGEPAATVLKLQADHTTAYEHDSRKVSS